METIECPFCGAIAALPPGKQHVRCPGCRKQLAVYADEASADAARRKFRWRMGGAIVGALMAMTVMHLLPAPYGDSPLIAGIVWGVAVLPVASLYWLDERFRRRAAGPPAKPPQNTEQ